MKFNTSVTSMTVFVAIALGLFLGLNDTPAAQPSEAGTSPVVSSTLDVCEDTVSGNWRYSGVGRREKLTDFAPSWRTSHFLRMA